MCNLYRNEVKLPAFYTSKIYPLKNESKTNKNFRPVVVCKDHIVQWFWEEAGYKHSSYLNTANNLWSTCFVFQTRNNQTFHFTIKGPAFCRRSVGNITVDFIQVKK